MNAMKHFSVLVKNPQTGRTATVGARAETADAARDRALLVVPVGWPVLSVIELDEDDE